MNPPKITKKAQQLLLDCFTRDGRVNCSAIATCRGTMPLWGQLALAGLVEDQGASGLGHSFNYAITQAGRAYVEGLR